MPSCIQKPFRTESKGRSLLNPEFGSMNQSHWMTAAVGAALREAALNDTSETGAPIAVSAM
jgi:hypothetical protein